MYKRAYALAVVFSSLACAQLTMDQKVLDFQQTVAVYTKNYGPYEWKQRAFGVDLLNTDRWLGRIRATKDDLEFYQVMSEWVAQLNDAHDSYFVPSNFVARLNFSVDLYDGKLLVDSINRTRLPASEYPFAVGYELVSIDGEDAMKILTRMMPYTVAANDLTTRRFAAELITIRPQSSIPSAPSVPESSTVVFRRFDGNTETYKLLWAKSGLPLTSIGKSPNLRASASATEEIDETPDYLRPLLRLQNCRLPARGIVSLEAVPPVFAGSMPPGFVQRLGRSQLDYFYSGTFESGGYKIGFIRIPTYAPLNLNDALAQFVREIQYFNENTDGLVIDQMRNLGGSVAYVNALLSYLFHYKWTSVGFSVRATSTWITSISSAYESAKAQGAPPQILEQLEAIKRELVEANTANRGLSKPIPLDSTTLDRDPIRDRNNNLLGYWRPIVVLSDETSASAADMFAATMQDNGRAVLFGKRTMGAGGNVTQWQTGTYSEAFATLTESLMVRKYERFEAGGLPVSPYVENVGVHPEIEVDYMTRANLFERGKPFVDAFTQAIVEHIRKNR